MCEGVQANVRPLSETLSKNVDNEDEKVVEIAQKGDKDVSDSDNEDKKEVLSYKQMLLNVAKTKFELRKKKFPKSRLKLKHTHKGQRVQIDLNFNVKAKKKQIKLCK